MYNYSEEDLQAELDRDGEIMDPEDDFINPASRLEDLGLGPKRAPIAPPDITSIPFGYAGPVVGHQVPVAQPPVPGWIEIRLVEVARSRGVVNTRGPYKGHVSLSGLARGTALATSTLMPLLKKDPDIRLLHVDTIARLCHYLKCEVGDILQFHVGVRPAGQLERQNYKRHPGE